MLQCYNRGCGMTYDPNDNNDESCRYHPGVPFFHDAYKGWTCCNKKSVDFTEFLSIKGCAVSKHSNVKPKEEERSPRAVLGAVLEKREVVARAPLKEGMERPDLESPMLAIQATVATALKNAVDTLSSKENVKSKISETDINLGAPCQHNSCHKSFTGTPIDNSPCIFHYGFPVFHEGLKYWSCCRKRTTDFAEFMAQIGCVKGQHNWVKANAVKKIDCRHDWHQTATNIIVSIYAKLYHYEQSRIEVNPIRLRLELIFPAQENGKFKMDMELSGIIDPSKTVAHMYGSKIEITMAKAEPGSWKNLNVYSPAVRTSKEKILPKPEEKQRPDAKEESDNDLDDIETAKEDMRFSELGPDYKDELD